MTNIRHILFPIDFSDRCCGAVPYVEAMAHRFGARVTLFSVVQPYQYIGVGDAVAATMIDKVAILNELTSRLEGAWVDDFAGLRVQRTADLGDPAQAIVDFARAEKVDLIMMPTHGYGPFRNLLLGSVTAKVLHDADGPVWTAAHVAGPPVREHVKTRAILCAVDRTPASVPLMKWASDLSKDFGATLRLVHAVPGIESWPARQTDREFEEELRTDARKTIEGLEESAGIGAPLCVAVGGVPEAVREDARRHGADLVVIGRGVLHETLGRLRSNAYGIIRESPCPVISV